MSVLVVAEHDNESLGSATLNTITAAGQLSDDVQVLVAGENCAAVADAAARIAGVSKVRCADDGRYANGLAEPLAALVVSLAGGYTHVLAPADKFGKNFLPRAAALLDVSSISDITEIKDADTFVRPIYAGNAIATVKSNDSVKLISVRMTAFDDAASEGGSASVEAVIPVDDPGISSFAGQDLTVSERPELVSARVVVSGGRGMQSADNFKLLEAVAVELLLRSEADPRLDVWRRGGFRVGDAAGPRRPHQADPRSGSAAASGGRGAPPDCEQPGHWQHRAAALG